MKKILLLLLCAIPASAQSIREAVYADLNKAGGVYYMMPVTAYAVTAPPKGYEPIYLSHYGRHGARYLLHAEVRCVQQLEHQIVRRVLGHVYLLEHHALFPFDVRGIEP